MISAISNPRYTISIVNWERLKRAHQLMRQCKIRNGMALYRTLLKNDMLRFIYDGTWTIIDDEDVPSANWACIYIAEYYHKERIMLDWTNLFSMVNPSLEMLSDKTKSRLISTHGWAQCLANRDLEQIVYTQLQALSQLKLDDYEIALHEILLSFVYRRLRKPREAIHYGWQSIQRLSIETEPYYLIRARDILASTYDVFSQYDEEYRVKANELHNETNRIVIGLGEDAEPEQQNYNLAWHYMKREDIATAIKFFKQGKANMQKHGLFFEEMLNTYGLSVAYLYLNRYDEALNFARTALDFFWRGGDLDLASHPISTVSESMTAVCLYIIAMVYLRQGRLEQALEKAQLAFRWHQRFDNPLQRAHVKRCMSEIYSQLGQIEDAQQWLEAALEDEALK